MKESQAVENPFKPVKSEMCFSWLCPECHTVNHLDWTHYKVYGPVDECKKCEKGFTVKTPWERP